MKFMKTQQSKKTKIKGYFICFTGIDGSGKSTISKKFVEIMNGNGLNFVYVYNRYKPFLLRPFIFIAGKLFLNKKKFFEDYVDYSNTKKAATKNHVILCAIYQYFVIVDYLLQSIYKIKIPLIFGKNIICDRYIYDTIATDLAVDLNYTEEKALQIMNKMERFFPKPNKVIFIDIPVEVAFQRKDDIPSIQYLKDRINFFNILVDSCNSIRLDGTKSIQELIYVLQNEFQKGIK